MVAPTINNHKRIYSHNCERRGAEYKTGKNDLAIVLSRFLKS